MIVTNGYFLVENTEDKADVVNNLVLYAKKNSKCFLFCFTEGIFSSTDTQKITEADSYLNTLLSEEQELLEVLNDSGYALIEFRSPYMAMKFAETYFFYKDEVDLLEKYVYCCVVDENGSIFMENYKSPRMEPAIKLSDVLTPEEMQQKLNELY